MPIPGNVYNIRKVAPCFPQERAFTLAIALGANLTLAEGTILAQNTVDGRWYPYVNGGANGLGTPRMVLESQCRTDATGRVALGDQLPGDRGQTDLTTFAFYAGDFRRGDLVGFDANAQATMGGRWLVNRNAAGDVYRLP